MENIIYYLFLYFVVIAIRFFKLNNELKEDFKKRRWEVIHISLEIVYTASGLVIALILNVPKNWIAVVVIVYIAIVIVAALLEMSDHNFSGRMRNLIHGVLIITVISVTIISFNYIITKSDINGHKLDEEFELTDSICKDEKIYSVLFPYQDHSLNRHVGYQKMLNKYFYVQVIVKTEYPDSIVEIGIEKILHDSLVLPVFPTKVGSDQGDIQFFLDRAIVKEKIKDNLIFNN